MKLGINFFIKTLVEVMSYIREIMVSNASNLKIVQSILMDSELAMQGKEEIQFISVLQMKAKVKMGEQTCVITFIEIKLVSICRGL